MQGLLKGLRTNIKLNYKTFTTDNLIFKFHYRFTTTLLFVMTLIITSQELIGEHIKCIADKGVPDKVINQFCYFTSTFTVLRHLTRDAVQNHDVAHPGVGAMGLNSGEQIKRHAYYQWVPFFLILQAIMFYTPHLIWKSKEGGRLQKLVAGLENAPFATEHELKIGDKKTPTKSSISKKLDELKIVFVDHLIVNRSWAFWMMFSEVLNFVNITFQIYFTDVFLGGQFLNLGRLLLRDGLASEVDILDIVFPKMTKCTFHKVGPSGTIQSHDAMCVMALNIINEKVFTILWFWFLFLFIASIIALAWRALTILLHSRSKKFNQLVFYFNSPGYINAWRVLNVTRYCNYKDWLFLVYLSKNMDGLVFNEFFIRLAQDLNPTYYHDEPEQTPEPAYAQLIKKD